LSVSSTSSIFLDGEPPLLGIPPFCMISRGSDTTCCLQPSLINAHTHTDAGEREEGTEVDAQLAAFLFLFPYILKQNEHAMEIVMPPTRSCHPMTWNTATAILLYWISYSIGSDRAGTTLSKLKNRN
jgi:hypothetical protein